MNDDIPPTSNCNSLPAQRQTLIRYLQEHRKITTLEAREKLGIMHPSGRIKELIEIHNYNIIKNWQTDQDAAGKKHRVAEYVLLSGKSSEVNHALR